MPIPTLFIQRQIKIPQQPCHYKSHLMIRQIPSNAVSGSEAERFMDISSVVVEGGGGVVCAFGKPAFWNEFFGAVEIALGVEGG
jgi:hypothetical protein